MSYTVFPGWVAVPAGDSKFIVFQHFSDAGVYIYIHLLYRAEGVYIYFILKCTHSIQSTEASIEETSLKQSTKTMQNPTK
jgi:hypothetical protein